MPPKKLIPPAWKVRRELRRVGRQIDDFFDRTFGHSPTGIYAKIAVDPKVVRLKGTMNLDQRVAVYLIFPNTGLLKSHEIALTYLIDCGYVPVVVSNLPLTDAELARLRALSAAVILRPNFGYDFGGYRDAMLFLAPNFPKIKYLALFNNSCWFPVQPTRNWPNEAEAMGLDFVGSTFHVMFPAKGIVDGIKTTWPSVLTSTRPHYGSFSLLIGERPLSDPSFLRFWHSYRMTSDKDATVRRGEHGLTTYMIENGFSHGATCDTAKLDDLLATLPTERLLQVASALISNMVPNLPEKIAAATAMDPPDRAVLVSLILTSVAIQGPAYALAEFDVKDRGGNFIKKAPVAWNTFTAQQTLRLLQSLETPQSEVFLTEAHAMMDIKFGKLTPLGAKDTLASDQT